MAEAAAREVVVAHLADQRRPQRLPFWSALGPAAGTAQGLAGGEAPAGQKDRFELGAPLP